MGIESGISSVVRHLVKLSLCQYLEAEFGKVLVTLYLGRDKYPEF